MHGSGDDLSQSKLLGEKEEALVGVEMGFGSALVRRLGVDDGLALEEGLEGQPIM